MIKFKELNNLTLIDHEIKNSDIKFKDDIKGHHPGQNQGLQEGQLQKEIKNCNKTNFMNYI